MIMKRKHRTEVLLLVVVSLLEIQRPPFVWPLMSTNCLSSSPGCSCAWKGGKFVADCSSQSLTHVPNVSSNSSLHSQRSIIR